MAIDRGKASRPVLPRPDAVVTDLGDTLEQAYMDAIYDPNTGKWMYKLSDGDWVEVPLDDMGIPQYDKLPPLPQKSA